MNRQNLFKSIKNLGKKFLGNINYANLKKGLQYTNDLIQGVEHLKGNPILGDKIKQITDSGNYEKFKSGVETINRLDQVYNHTKGLKINNVLPIKKDYYENLNKQGEQEALRKHFERVQLHPMRRPSMTEEQMATRIVNNIR